MYGLPLLSWCMDARLLKYLEKVVITIPSGGNLVGYTFHHIKHKNDTITLTFIKKLK